VRPLVQTAQGDGAGRWAPSTRARRGPQLVEDGHTSSWGKGGSPPSTCVQPLRSAGHPFPAQAFAIRLTSPSPPSTRRPPSIRVDRPTLRSTILAAGSVCCMSPSCGFYTFCNNHVTKFYNCSTQHTGFYGIGGLLDLRLEAPPRTNHYFLLPHHPLYTPSTYFP